MFKSEICDDRSAAPSRAIGSMFLAMFGSCWIAAWVYQTYGSAPAILAVLAVATVGFLGLAVRHYMRVRTAPRANAASTKRYFYLINTGQWFLIFLAMRMLRANGHPDWIVPAVMFIVGLHFLPLARLFSYRPHYLTGYALMLLALTYPLVGPGPANPLGCLAAGLVLWASALWANAGARRSLRAF